MKSTPGSRSSTGSDHDLQRCSSRTQKLSWTHLRLRCQQSVRPSSLLWEAHLRDDACRRVPYSESMRTPLRPFVFLLFLLWLLLFSNARAWICLHSRDYPSCLRATRAGGPSFCNEGSPGVVPLLRRVYKPRTLLVETVESQSCGSYTIQKTLFAADITELPVYVSDMSTGSFCMTHVTVIQGMHQTLCADCPLYDPLAV